MDFLSRLSPQSVAIITLLALITAYTCLLLERRKSCADFFVIIETT